MKKTLKGKITKKKIYHAKLISDPFLTNTEIQHFFETIEKTT